MIKPFILHTELREKEKTVSVQKNRAEATPLLNTAPYVTYLNCINLES
jgi:hypothetical protein